LRTLAPLQISQIAALARQRIWRPNNLCTSLPTGVSLRPLTHSPSLSQWPEWQRPCSLTTMTKRVFSFLNVTRHFPARIPWSSQEIDRLWVYHLNYFDFLNVNLNSPDQEAAVVTALRLGLEWCRDNTTGREIGWEPYPLSLRIVNWLKFLLRNAEAARQCGCGETVREILNSLRRQVRALESRLETHLMGNHLLKNAKALIFAGALLDSPENEHWYRKGEIILRRQLREQILPDGGHFERSPMYHGQVLEDLLDLRALSAATSRLLACDLELEEAIGGMGTFLRDVLHPDGEIPLFGDSALSAQPAASEILGRVPVMKDTLPPCRREVAIFKFSGYAIMRDPSGGYLVFDCGPIGPGCQPGHGHCDLLSYELSLNHRRIVVDTGASTYERGEDRHYERSTCAHNTLRIDGEEQAEIWASFRVGRRPKPGAIEAGVSGGCRFVRGHHFGYRHLGVVHRRTIFHVPESSWVVVDKVLGTGQHRIESFIHFHPNVFVKHCQNKPCAGADERRWVFLLQTGNSAYHLLALTEGDLKLKDSWYAPEFGFRTKRSVIHWTVERPLPALMVYAFIPASMDTRACRITSDGSIQIGSFILPAGANTCGPGQCGNASALTEA
jgi:uncharacterized heparinase superfamily protein